MLDTCTNDHWHRVPFVLSGLIVVLQRCLQIRKETQADPEHEHSLKPQYTLIHYTRLLLDTEASVSVTEISASATETPVSALLFCVVYIADSHRLHMRYITDNYRLEIRYITDN